VFGVLTDFHATRRDAGIPTFFDGWYSHRADAEAALDYWRRRMPGADVRLVVSGTPPPHFPLRAARWWGMGQTCLKYRNLRGIVTKVDMVNKIYSEAK
jgi:hypothetical protein